MSLPRVTDYPHRFGGTEYRSERREMGHVHDDFVVDVPLPLNVRNRLVAEKKAEPHHVLPSSGWVTVYLEDEGDVDRALEVLRLSYELASRATVKPVAIQQTAKD